ncbi:MAG TPA: hypothetical protein VHZ24_21430 [Pirellulales bacterium]|jgi:hypothetical protein|nr:hypothetical protein [Pirellulales bacterium]
MLLETRRKLSAVVLLAAAACLSLPATAWAQGLVLAEPTDIGPPRFPTGLQTDRPPSITAPLSLAPPPAESLLNSPAMELVVAPIVEPPVVPTPQWMAEGNALMRGPSPVNLNLPAQKPGWVASVEVAVLQPNITSTLDSGTLLDGTFPGSPVQLPVGAMNFTGAPKIELGYRWPDGLGEFRASYRYIGSIGSGTVLGATPADAERLRTRLSINVVDFDYCFSEFNPGDLPVILPVFEVPGWLGMRRPPKIYQRNPLVMRLRVGARTATMFFDSEATGTTISERMMNNFVGVGMHLGLEVTKAMPWRPLSMYGRADFSGVLGDTSQSFQRIVAGGPAAAAHVGGIPNGVPMFAVEAGLSYVPPRFNQRFRGTIAYQYEQWWNFADRTDEFGAATLQLSGVVVRGNWGF